MRRVLSVLAVLSVALVVAGCGSVAATSASIVRVSGVPRVVHVSPGSAAICSKALGVVVLSEVGDSAQRRAVRARSTADALSQLAAQAQSASLASALRGAADQAREAAGQSWSSARLRAWAGVEQARFDALRAACS